MVHTLIQRRVVEQNNGVKISPILIHKIYVPLLSSLLDSLYTYQCVDHLSSPPDPQVFGKIWTEMVSDRTTNRFRMRLSIRSRIFT